MAGGLVECRGQGAPRMVTTSPPFSGAAYKTFSWLRCVKSQIHEPENLMPTQIIPGKGTARGAGIFFPHASAQSRLVV